jgi:hypothetical protein
MEFSSSSLNLSPSDRPSALSLGRKLDSKISIPSGKNVDGTTEMERMQGGNER